MVGPNLHHHQRDISRRILLLVLMTSSHGHAPHVFPALALRLRHQKLRHGRLQVEPEQGDLKHQRYTAASDGLRTCVASCLVPITTRASRQPIMVDLTRLISPALPPPALRALQHRRGLPVAQTPVKQATLNHRVVCVSRSGPGWPKRKSRPCKRPTCPILRSQLASVFTGFMSHGNTFQCPLVGTEAGRLICWRRRASMGEQIEPPREKRFHPQSCCIINSSRLRYLDLLDYPTLDEHHPCKR